MEKNNTITPIATPGYFDGQVGGGLQYRTSLPVQALVKHGFLRTIER